MGFFFDQRDNLPRIPIRAENELTPRPAGQPHNLPHTHTNHGQRMGLFLYQQDNLPHIHTLTRARKRASFWTSGTTVRSFGGWCPRAHAYSTSLVTPAALACMQGWEALAMSPRWVWDSCVDEMGTSTMQGWEALVMPRWVWDSCVGGMGASSVGGDGDGHKQ